MRLKLVAGILVCLALLLYPATAALDTPYQKVVIITIAYDHGVTKELSSEIRYGTAPNLNLQSGTITGTLRDSQKNPIQEFSIRDPRTQTGDAPLNSGPDTGRSLAGYMEYSEEGVFSLIVPYTPDLRYVDLMDVGSGVSLASIDLSSAILEFQKQYPEDPDIMTLQLPGSSAPALIPGQILVIAGIAVISLAGIGYYAAFLRKRPVQILIVDDEKDIVELFSLLLTQKGYLTIPARSGEECLDILKTRKRRPDLILLDIMMYPLDGWSTLEEIKKDPDLRKIPVLMLTAMQPTPADAKRYGVCIEDYILKPVKPRELYSAIEYVLMRRELIDRDVRKASRAGFERDVVCEYARLTRRVEVEKKLMGILQSSYGSPNGSRNDITVSLDDIAKEIQSREETLKRLQSQLSPVLAPEPSIRM
ncbi:MAG: response regulator [Methanoregulaceae archaeon]